MNDALLTGQHSISGYRNRARQGCMNLEREVGSTTDLGLSVSMYMRSRGDLVDANLLTLVISAKMHTRHETANQMYKAQRD